MIRATGDTNVLASGFIGRSETSAPAQVLDAWRKSRFTLVLSEYLLAELARTFASPYFRRRLTATEADANVALLRQRATIASLSTVVRGAATHPEDDAVLATAVSGNAAYLITGDR